MRTQPKTLAEEDPRSLGEGLSLLVKPELSYPDSAEQGVGCPGVNRKEGTGSRKAAPGS